MILEVNNTFDERRMYFLKNTGAGALDPFFDTTHDGSNLDHKPQPRFTHSWSKDFHVSPFNSRKGSYSLVADDPFSPSTNCNRPVNNTITLTSSKSHAKLIARVFSTSGSINPSTFNRWDTFRFLVLWWWVGFVTFPRIVKEAGKLFFKRKLHVWYRPEVLRESIGRHETSDERAIATSFCSLLRYRVENSDLSFPIRFESGISTNWAPELITPKHLRLSQESPAPDPIVLQITTPLFYSRLARHQSISNFLTSEIHNSDDKSRTMHISKNPEAIISLFSDNPRKDPYTTKPSPLLTRLRWSLVFTLRSLAHKQRNPHLSPVSSLDEFVMRHETPAISTKYRRAVLKLLASDVFTFGVPEILDAASWSVRVMLCCMHVLLMKEMVLKAILVWGWLPDGATGMGGFGAGFASLGVHGWRVLGQCW